MFGPPFHIALASTRMQGSAQFNLREESFNSLPIDMNRFQLFNPLYQEQRTLTRPACSNDAAERPVHPEKAAAEPGLKF